jgi:hypothetical protein
MLVRKVFDVSFSHNKNILVILPSEPPPPPPPPIIPFRFHYFQFVGEICGRGCYKVEEVLQLPPRRRRALRNEGEFVGRPSASNKNNLVPVMLMLHAERRSILSTEQT